MKDPIEYHHERAEECDDALRDQKDRSRWTVFGRVLVFLALIGSVWLTWDMHPVIPFGCASFFLVAFLFLVRFHARLEDEKERLEEQAKLHREDLQRIKGEPPEMKEDEEPDPEHPFALDLDLMIDGGIFPWIDRTFSHPGKQMLRERLLHPDTDPERIRRVQEAVKELAGRRDERMERRAKGRKLARLPEHPFHELRNGIARIYPGWLLVIVPLLILGLFVATTLEALSFGQFLLSLILPAALLGMQASRVQASFQRMEEERKSVRGIRSVLKDLEGKTYKAELLRQETDKVARADRVPASKALASLDRILEAYDSRSNPFVGIVLNLFLLWDLQVHDRLRVWTERYGAELPQWVEAIGAIDSLESLAAMASDHPSFSFPEPASEGAVLEAEGLGHPLIPEGTRVDNDLLLPDTGHIKIITGANMAGKSTFLRTVGVNSVLARAGTVVCARRMRFRPLKLFTSMRASDSLKEGESYFFAELKRLRMLVDELEKGEELLILLDEILQGTNSDDKKEGSRRFLTRILRFPVSGLIATHDLDLTRMEESHPGKVENLSFEVELEDGESRFDHRLRQGVCRNMNASALLERMGIG